MATKRGAVQTLARLADRRARVAMLVIGGLRLAERVLLTAGALSFSAEHLQRVLAITVALAVVASLRATVRAPFIARVRTRFVTTVARTLLQRRAPATQAESSVVLFDGLWVAEELLVDRIPGLVADGIAAIALGVIALATLPLRFVIVGGAALVVAGLALEGARRVAGAHAQRSYDAFLPVAADIEACAEGGLELVANGRAGHQEKRVADRAANWARIGWRADWLAGLSGRMPVLVGFLALMIGVIQLEVSGGASLEASLMKALVLASFLPPYASLLRNIVELAQARPKLAAVAGVLDEASESPAPTLALDEPATPIRWGGIDFAYECASGPTVLTNLTGEWRPDRVLGITGPNGAGKSTFSRLLLGLERPTRGAIEGARSRSVAYLPQRPFFASDVSVRDAIRFLAPQATDAAMEQALRRVNVWEGLTEPLDLPVATLSAGQRQRVALARVLLQDAALLFLDEPDANLDKSGTAILVDVLRAERSRRMIAFIAHDPELLVAADDVLSLDKPS